ncbi:phage antirepressor KilAC domain-containing protein [Alloalcanivorax xenomutans]|uniref:phage antirepressor KilAC domain-containing protein n=1 Tax=Alloalcanivorax xenomutans TaxID=1094342 RepID=UPI001F2C561A|nr:phage antirepressor KilAC domain-containing protein [Alloalcanivorax xenomutans]MCE7521940.1 phage antirepressor KilAC domain-containing protein [Alloalcanivorax xenomutans]
MPRTAKSKSYRFREAARLLGITQRDLRRRLERLQALQPDGVTGAPRAHPNWLTSGYLVERQEQYQHPHVGPQWYVRIEITEAGLARLRPFTDCHAA